MTDFRITIDVKNVGPGDVHGLADDIEAQFGDSYDAALGDFIIRVSQKSGDGYFSRERDDDLLPD